MESQAIEPSVECSVDLSGFDEKLSTILKDFFQEKRIPIDGQQLLLHELRRSFGHSAAGFNYYLCGDPANAKDRFGTFWFYFDEHPQGNACHGRVSKPRDDGEEETEKPKKSCAEAMAQREDEPSVDDTTSRAVPAALTPTGDRGSSSDQDSDSEFATCPAFFPHIIDIKVSDSSQECTKLRREELRRKPCQDLVAMTEERKRREMQLVKDRKRQEKQLVKDMRSKGVSGKKIRKVLAKVKEIERSDGVMEITSSRKNCALETLNTKKFAQRAKFIRNNAVVNGDASGDLNGLRLEIQELKVGSEEP